MSPGNSCNGRGLSAGSLHERATVHLFGGVLVMGSAQQPSVLCTVDVRSRKTVHVIEFEGARLGTPATKLVGERAASSVALEHDPLDGVGDVTRSGRGAVLDRCRPWLAP